MVVTCEQIWREVSNYLDNDIDPALAAGIEEHSAGCAKCRAVIDGTRNIIAIYGDERLFPLPLGFPSRLRRKLAPSRHDSPMFWSRNTWLAAAAAMVLVLGGISLMRAATYRSAAQLSAMAEPARGIPPQLAVVVGTGSKLFHIAGCEYLHSENGQIRSLTAAEAVHQGYTPCPRCLSEYLAHLAADFKQKPLYALE